MYSPIFVALLQVSSGFGAETFTSGLLGALVGFATALALFRSRFTAVEKDIAHLKETVDERLRHMREDNARAWDSIRADVARLCKTDDEFWKNSERRQKFMLEGIASLMQQQKITHRVTDAVARLVEGGTEEP